MAIKYRIKTGRGYREFTEEEYDLASEYAVQNNSSIETLTIPESQYNSILAAELSIAKGKELADYMLIQLNSKSKEYTKRTGSKINKSLRDSHRKLRESLELGDLEEAVLDIQVIVNSGTVDNFLDLYADVLLRIDNFLGAN